MLRKTQLREGSCSVYVCVQSGCFKCHGLSQGLFCKQPHFTYNVFHTAIVRVIKSNQNKLFTYPRRVAAKIWKHISNGQSISRFRDTKEAAWLGVE